MKASKIPPDRLEHHLNRLALSILQPLGFSEGEDGCLRKFDGGEQFIAIAVTDIGQKNEVRPLGATGLVQPFLVKRHFLGAGSVSGQFQIEYPYFSGIPIQGRPCQTQADLPETEAWLQEFLPKQMVPCLEEYSDPRAILQAYLAHDETKKNTTDALAWKGWNSAATGLIYARLYGPERYPALKQRYARIFDPLLPQYKDQVAKLLAYLDQDQLKKLPD